MKSVFFPLVMQFDENSFFDLEFSSNQFGARFESVYVRPCYYP